MTKLNRDKTAAIDVQVHWRRIDTHTPRGVKMWLINRAAGAATIGQLGTDEPFFDHWHPLPTFQKKP